MQARSLTVPQMDSLPILPPGKKAGDTTNPSVDTAILFPVRVRTAASSAVRYGLDQLRGLFAARAVGQCYCVTDHL